VGVEIVRLVAVVPVVVALPEQETRRHRPFLEPQTPEVVVVAQGVLKQLLMVVQAVQVS